MSVTAEGVIKPIFLRIKEYPIDDLILVNIR